MHVCKCNYTSIRVCVHVYTQLHIDTHEKRKEKERREKLNTDKAGKRKKEKESCVPCVDSSFSSAHTHWLAQSVTIRCNCNSLHSNFSVEFQCQQTNSKKTVPLFSPEHCNNDKRNHTKMSTVNTDGFLKSFVYPRLPLWGGGRCFVY